MVEDKGETKDSSADLFEGIQEDDGASDDETDSFKKASEQAYKEHLEEQSRRQSLRPQTASRPQTPSSADRKRRAVEQQDERFRFRPETPRVDYIPPAVRQHSARPVNGSDIDHAAWGSWLSPGCSYTQLMGPKTGRPATAYAPREGSGGLDWRDVVGRQEKGRQPWQDVKPHEGAAATGRDVTHRQAHGEEAQPAGSATPRQNNSPYLATRKCLRRPFSASVADKRRKMHSKALPSTAFRESPQRRRKEAAGMRSDGTAERSSETPTGADVLSVTSEQGTPPENMACGPDESDGTCSASDVRPDSGPSTEHAAGLKAARDSGASNAVQRMTRATPFMASIEERLNSMCIRDVQLPHADFQAARSPSSDAQPPDLSAPLEAPNMRGSDVRTDEDSTSLGSNSDGTFGAAALYLDVRILSAEGSLHSLSSGMEETDSPSFPPFPARPFTAGITRPKPVELNPLTPSRPATAPVKPCVPSLSESFSRMGLSNAASRENSTVTGRSDRNPASSRSSAGKALSAYARRVMAPPQFVQLTPWNAKMVEDVSQKVAEANRLSRALGLSVRYSMSQDGKRDVWVEVYEARTLLKHGHVEEREQRGRAREWRDDLLDDPAEAAALSAVRNVDAIEPADEMRGSKLRDVSVDVFLRTHRRLHKAATDARFRGFLSLEPSENSASAGDGKEGDGKKELWEELGVNEGFAKILTKAREQATQDKHSIASSGRSSAIRGRLIGSTEGLIEITNPLLKGPYGLYGQSNTSSNVTKAMSTFSNYSLSMAQRQEVGQKRTNN